MVVIAKQKKQFFVNQDSANQIRVFDWRCLDAAALNLSVYHYRNTSRNF